MLDTSWQGADDCGIIVDPLGQEANPTLDEPHDGHASYATMANERRKMDAICAPVRNTFFERSGSVLA